MRAARRRKEPDHGRSRSETKSMVGGADRAVLRGVGAVLPDDGYVGPDPAAALADFYDAVREIPDPLAAYPADAGDHHARLRPRRGVGRRARRRYRRVQDRLRYLLSAARRLLLDSQGRHRADPGTVVRLRYCAGRADGAVDLLLPDRGQYRHR